MDIMRLRQLSIIVIIAGLFGIVVSIVKGNDSGVRDAIGNVCTPWLVLPFLANAFVGKRQIFEAALIGLLTSITALAGFYLAESFVLDLGPHPWVVDLGLTMSAGRMYFMLGLLIGPVFGALGGWYIRRRTTTIAVMMAALFVLEPCVWTVYELFFMESPSFSGFSSFVNYPTVSAVEAAIGIISCIVLINRSKLTRPC